MARSVKKATPRKILKIMGSWFRCMKYVKTKNALTEATESAMIRAPVSLTLIPESKTVVMVNKTRTTKTIVGVNICVALNNSLIM